MRELEPAPLSPLAAVAVPGRYGHATGATPPVSLKERRGLKLCVIAALGEQGSIVAETVRKLTGLELPSGPKRVVAKGLALIGTAPGQWLAIAEDADSRQMLDVLAKQLAGHAAITEQSDSKAVIRISGTRARAVLAKGCSLDLHPRVFKPGDAATTPIALIDCQLWQIDDAPSYDLAVPSSFAESFWSWLTASAAEYGYAVEP
jgi:heterotetrameric sarcosine oxidase gamma subunit